jgi:hypothetical protein
MADQDPFSGLRTGPWVGVNNDAVFKGLEDENTVVPGGVIEDQSITNAKIVNLNAEKIDAGTLKVTGSMSIETSGVTPQLEIGPNGTIMRNNAGSTILEINGATTTLNADIINSGTINGDNVNVTNIDADNITSGTISAASVLASTITNDPAGVGLLIQGEGTGVDAGFGGVNDAVIYAGYNATTVDNAIANAPNSIYLSPTSVTLPDYTTGSGIQVVGDVGASIVGGTQALIGTSNIPLTGNTAYFGPSTFGSWNAGITLYSENDSITMISAGDITATTPNFDLTGDAAIHAPATIMLESPLTTVTGTLSSSNVTSAGNITLNSGGDVILQMDANDVVVQDTEAANGTNPRILFRDKSGTTYTGIKSGAANVVQILNGTSATDYAQLWAERIYPMNGSTASRYIYDDGTRTAFSGGIDVNGSSTLTTATFSSTVISSSAATAFSATGTGNVSLSGGGDVVLTGADTSVPITGNGELLAIPNTTTLTTNSARWVLISGSQYGLRRDSSTRRVKTNIIEADEAVLAAAKNLRAVHYEALEKDEEGNTVPSGNHTLGLIAEEIVEAGLGCAVTYDGEGLPDGYDERVIIAALLHRINDLETRLSALEGA